MRHQFQALILLILTITLAALCGQLRYADLWYAGTVINGTDLSDMTLAEAVEILHGTGYEITVYGRDGGSDTISAEDISLETDIEEQLSAIFAQQHKSLALLRMIGGTQETELTFRVSYDADAAAEALSGTILVTGSDDYEIQAPSGTTVAWTGSFFEVKGSTEGNVLIPDAALPYLYAALDNLETELDLSALDVYETLDDAEELEDPDALCAEANAYALHWITWELEDGLEETLTPEELSEWISIEDGEVVFDEDALFDWVEDFCAEYKTVGLDREFTTHDGEIITISDGDYGWRLNYEEICEDALDAVEDSDEDAVAAYIAEATDETQEALSVTLEPVYKNEAYQMDYDTYVDWDPDNYSEVDISEQMVYVYKDGELAYSCICVTGLPNGERDTSTGVWYIKDKKTEYTMTSERYGYTTDTKYWIRITWSGIGYHYMARSDWGSWSSTLYLTAGSHGCVNLRYEDAKAIYSLVSVYDAVFIHE